MKGRAIVLDHLHGREAAALLVDGRLDDLLVDDDAAPRPGTIFRATCDRGLKGQGGMILRLPPPAPGLPRPETAWLRSATGLKAGETLLVQVTGVAEGGKAVPVTDRLLFKSRFAIVTPGAPGTNVSRQIRDETERANLVGFGQSLVGGEAELGPDRAPHPLRRLARLQRLHHRASLEVAEHALLGPPPRVVRTQCLLHPDPELGVPHGLAMLSAPPPRAPA